MARRGIAFVVGLRTCLWYDLLIVIEEKVSTRWYRAGLCFSCTGCGGCCTGPGEGYVWVTRPEIHYTRKHGRWLQIAEIELSVLSRQCLDGRIDGIERLRSECATWDQQGNKQQKGVDRRFTTPDARSN